MRKVRALALLVLAACGSATEPVVKPNPKLDPYFIVRVRNQLDTTTAPGRAHWHIYELFTGPYDRLNGIQNQGAISLEDLRLNHYFRCVGAQADSVGQRFVSILAVADTTTSNLTPDATAFAFVQAWYDGNHTPPAGWMAIALPPTDAWTSAQFTAGHGLVSTDPIKWGLDWTGRGAINFYERPSTDTDPLCTTF